MSIRLFTEGAGQGLKIYNETEIDLEAALEVEGNTISENISLEQGSGINDIYLISLNSDGLREAFSESGVPLISAVSFTIPDYSTTDYNLQTGSVFQSVWTPNVQPVAPLPIDYDLHFNTKYFTDSSVDTLYPLVINAPSRQNFGFDKNLYVSNEPFAWAFWTSNNDYFGISHYWSYSYLPGVGGYLGETFGFFHNQLGDQSMLPREDGMNGTKLVDDWNPSDFSLFYSTTAVPQKPCRMGAIWISAVYEERNYIGMLAFQYSDDGIPLAAKGFLISVRFFDFNANIYYNPETSEPELGAGAHNLPNRTAAQTPDRMIPRGMFETGISGSGAAPGSIGLKLVRAPLTVLNSYLAAYMAAHSGAFDNQSQALDNIGKSILDTFMLPIPVTMSDSQQQFEICGDVLSGHGTISYNCTQQQIVDCGSIVLPEEEGSYLDYEPFTKAIIYIPYCGQYEIPINSFMGGSVQLTYSIDVLTGDCVAYVFSQNRFGNQLLLGTFPGNMRLPIPCTVSGNNLGVIGSALQKSVQLALTGVNGVAKSASGFSAAPDRGSFTTSQNYSYGGQNYGSGQVFDKAGYMGAMGQVALNNVMPALNVAGQGANAIFGALNTAGELNSAPVALSSVIGSWGGSSSFNMPQIPYIKIIKSICRVSETHHLDKGLPSNITVKVGDLEPRFTILSNVRLNQVSDATAQEQAEIYRLLTTGFYT